MTPVPQELLRRHIMARLPGYPPWQGIRPAACSDRNIKKYGRRRESSQRWPAPALFSFATGTCPDLEKQYRGTAACRKIPLHKKACCGTCHATAQEASRRKKTPQRIPSAGSARKTRRCRKKQQDSGGGNLPFLRKTANVPADHPWRRKEKDALPRTAWPE